MKLLLEALVSTLIFFMCVEADTRLQVLLESFDNSAGGGRLYNSANRCDPFWFAGLDQCDIALQICVEPGQASTQRFQSCPQGWIDLGKVSDNRNKVSFAPGKRYGGWTNPMGFSFKNSFQSFTVKILAQDVDRGSRQLIDQMVCNVNVSSSTQNGITTCQHVRPNGEPTLVKFSYIKSTVQPTHCSGQGGWRADACCKIACPRAFANPLPVLLISLDGFRADYLKRNKTRAIQRLIDCGIHTNFMYSSYPTVTFPNHYTIATVRKECEWETMSFQGLYPESHGIIDNNMYDPTITPADERHFHLGSKSSFNPQWWHGEPFWNTVMKNGMIAGTYFWPGSEVKIQNMRPNYWFRYNGSVPFLSRVDTIIQWLLYPKSKRPNFMTLYFDEPDHFGHVYGPQSPQVTKELGVVDAVIDYLMTQLYANNLFHCVNIIIIADHGMKTIIPGVHVDLNQYFNTSGMYTFAAPVGRVMLGNSSLTSQQVVSSLKCKNSSFRAYARKDVPIRFHYSRSHRIGDLIVDTDPGLVVSKYPYSIIGTHGWDFRVNSMHALFVAHGPSFKQNYSKESFENIELYNLLSTLLNIKTKAPGNGTNGILNDLLINLPNITEKPKQFTHSCPVYNTNTVASCGTCNQLNKPAFTSVATVSLPDQSNKNHQTLCNLPTKISTNIYSRTTGINLPVLGAGQLGQTSVLALPNKGCNFLFQNWTNCNNLTANLQYLASQNASLYPLFPFTDGNSTSSLLYQKVPMYNGFYSGVTGIWTSLLIQTQTWMKKYGSLLLHFGPIFDYNSDGLLDSIPQIQNQTQGSGWPIPTAYFAILIRCDSGFIGIPPACLLNSAVHVLSFVLPHRPLPINCQDTMSYLFMHTAKVRDIEHLTGLHFFADRSRYSFADALRLRLHINQQLW